MKYLIEFYFKPEHRKDVSKVIEKFEQPEQVKTVFAAHTCVASNRGIGVVEVDNLAYIQKMAEPLLDFVELKVTPILPVFPESE
jgi:hypothetical protein